MKQYAFEKEYAELWQEYDVLSKALEERKSAYQVKNTHPPSGNYEFPSLYRRICHHYAIAQQRHYSPQLINQLHQRVLLGHQLLYEHKSSTLWRMFSFLWMTFPQQVRKHWQHFWLATALFYVPAILMGLACYNDSEFIYQSMSSHEVSSMEYMYDPANDKIGRRAERQSDSDFMMFGFYIYNNISIGFRSYATGILAGIGTIFIMLYNGTVIGGVAGHLTQLGFIETFWPFVSGHGSFELTALCICGAAGLRLGQPLIAPGRHRRIDAFKIAGHESVQLVLGAAFMLLVAAFIEAFWSSSSFVTNEIKYLVGAFLWFVVIVYLSFAGKTEK